eukprot:8861044-Pyramimonas_sp.AAC.1
MPALLSDAKGHESFSLPPDEPDIRRVWHATKVARMARLADQVLGARQAQVDPTRLIEELAIVKTMLHLMDTPMARITQYRSQVESRIQRQQIVESQIHDLKEEYDEIKHEIASLKALIYEAKQHRELAELSAD